MINFKQTTQTWYGHRICNKHSTAARQLSSDPQKWQLHINLTTITKISNCQFRGTWSSSSTIPTNHNSTSPNYWIPLSSNTLFVRGPFPNRSQRVNSPQTQFSSPNIIKYPLNQSVNCPDYTSTLIRLFNFIMTRCQSAALGPARGNDAYRRVGLTFSPEMWILWWYFRQIFMVQKSLSKCGRHSPRFLCDHD